MIVVLAEKPSGPRHCRRARRQPQANRLFWGTIYQVTYVFGHLVTIAEPEAMNPAWGWTMELSTAPHGSLPMALSRSRQKP